MGGSIGTFDDLFRRIGRSDGERRRVVTDAQRTLLLRRVVERARPQGLGRSARFTGFADALGATVAELESALLEPSELDGERDDQLAELYAAYREELERLGLSDRELERRRAAERLAGELDAWDGRAVFAYGFEDLTGAEWALLEALAARSDVTVSLPYEPGRDAFASLSRTAEDLAALADEVEELPPNPAARSPVLAHLERGLFCESASGNGRLAAGPELDGSLRFLEGAGLRGTLELLADEVLALLRAGTPAEEIGVVCPSIDRWRAALDTAFVTLGVPYAVEGRVRLGQTPFGQALLGLLRYAWLDGERRDLFSFLRSQYSGLARAHVDFLEGRLRGRGVNAPARVEEEVEKLRQQPLPQLGPVRAADDPLVAIRDLARAMVSCAHGKEAPPTTRIALLDLRAQAEVARLADQLGDWRDLGGELSREDVVALLERATVRLAGAGEAGRVAVLDLMRARTRRFEALFVLGLEEGGLPRRTEGSPFLDEERKAELERSSRSGRLLRTDPVSRDRYLFYTACTRPTRRLYLVREAANDDGAPREPSPFWDEVRGLFAAEDAERWTRRRSLPALTWPVETAPSERERLRALAWLASDDARSARPLARANGWDRRLERALEAFDRPTRLTHPAVLEELRQKTSFSVTDLERFADCSSMWLFERLVSPRSIDAEVDALLRGSVAHQALCSFYKGLPKRTGAEQVQAETLDDALEFMRECLAADARGSRPGRPAGARAARAEGEPLPRPRAARAQRGRVAVAARPEPVRGLVRLRALRPRAAARPRSRRLHRLREDRPHRSRPVRGARDRGRLQVGPHRCTRRGRSRPSSTSRSRSTCSSCATSSGSSRSAASTARSPARGRRAGCCGRRRATTACPGSRATTTSTRRRSGGRSTAPRSTRARWSSGSGRATCATTRRTDSRARPGATSGRCAG